MKHLTKVVIKLTIKNINFKMILKVAISGSWADQTGKLHLKIQAA